MTAAPSAPERAVGPSTALSVARARMGGTDGMLWGPEERAAVPPELGWLDFPLGDLGQSPVPRPSVSSFVKQGSLHLTAGSEELRPK